MRRQLPTRRDLAPLLRFKQPTWSPKDRTSAEDEHTGSVIVALTCGNAESA